MPAVRKAAHRMVKPRRNSPLQPSDMSALSAKRRKAIPHEFVLDALAYMSPRTHPMFGCIAIYVDDKIVLILRDKPNQPADNGVWLATTTSITKVFSASSPACDPSKYSGKT